MVKVRFICTKGHGIPSEHSAEVERRVDDFMDFIRAIERPAEELVQLREGSSTDE